MLTGQPIRHSANGFKAYGEDGAQLPPEDADLVAARYGQHDRYAITWSRMKKPLCRRPAELFCPVDQAYDRCCWACP